MVGSGGVLGRDICHEFAAAGYKTVGLRRRGSEAKNDSAIPTQYCDLEDAIDTRKAIEKVVSETGRVDVLVCNTAHLIVAPFLDLTIDDFRKSWNASLTSAIVSAQTVLPGMLENGKGAILFSGATASMRGSSRFGAFSAAKFALRGLAQSMAREYQTHGVHVVHVVLDGLLRGSASVERFGGRAESAMDTAQIAKTYVALAEQSGTAWTHEIDLRPQGEKF